MKQHAHIRHKTEQNSTERAFQQNFPCSPFTQIETYGSKYYTGYTHRRSYDKPRAKERYGIRFKPTELLHGIDTRSVSQQMPDIRMIKVKDEMVPDFAPLKDGSWFR